MLLGVMLGGVGECFSQVDAKADRIIKDAQSKINGLLDLTMNFKLSLSNRADSKDKPMVKQGIIKIKKNKYKADFGEQSLVSDGATVWNYLKKEKEVNVSSYDSLDGLSMENMFKLYKKDMKVRYDNVEVVGGKSVDKITLFPNDKKQEYFKVEVWIDGKLKLPVQMKVWGRNGSVSVYELSNHKENSNLGDSEFNFNVADYPGIQVIDLR